MTRTGMLLFAGDTIPNKPFTLGPLLKQLCAEHDIRVFNLEGAFSRLGKPLFKAGPHLLLEPAYFEAVRGCFNVATLANNHAMDYDAEGLQTTIQLCKNASISTVGAGSNLASAFTPLDIGNCRFISVAENEFGAADVDRAGVATVDRPNEIYEVISQGRQAGKFVVVVAHGGTEVIPIPPPYLRQRYKLWVEYGADLVIGNHPHVVQGFEWHRGKAIFYCLGNFFFSTDTLREYANSDWSIIVSVNTANNNIRIIPVRCDNNNTVDIVADNRLNEIFANLCRMITADNYIDTYNTIAGNLFKSWFPRLVTAGPDEAALFLHYFRCDAHRNLIQTAYMHQTGEIRPGAPTVKTNAGIKDKRREIYDVCGEKMQMSFEERQMLRQVLQNKNTYLETGAGYSTIWASQFAGKVVSVESRKKWFDEIMLCIEQSGIQNIDLHLFPPEPCAYYPDGSEKWTRRNSLQGSDYGWPEEFTGYLKGIERLLDNNHFDVVLVDGNVRQQVVEMLIAKNYGGIVLLHDVTPEREYLNGPILSIKGVKIVSRAGSLAQLCLPGQKSTIYSQPQPGPQPAATSRGLNKIIGFCMSRRDDALNFAFHRHFPWLHFEKLRIGRWFVHLWGHGDFSPFIKQENNRIKIIAGYTQQEFDFLGPYRLENRGVFINIGQDTVDIENDIVGSFRVFYGCGNSNVCVSSTEDLVLQSVGRQPIDKTNLLQFLMLGHLTGQQTIWPHIFTMKANSSLSFNGRTFENKELTPISFQTSASPVDDLYAITVSTIRKYTDDYDKLFLPLSGGYDSRMLAACIRRPETVTARTYDYIYPLETGWEASRARVFAKTAGISDWNICDLGSDFFADYGRRWFDIFGTSHHLHGMYILSFYDKAIGSSKAPVPIVSGYIGDAFVDHQLHAFEEVRNADAVTKFLKSQFIGPEGFSKEDLRKILNYDIDSLLPAIYARWEQNWNNCQGQEHQKFILNLVQHRARSHISYLCTLADLYGAAITPYTDRTYIETVLGLPYKFLFNRMAQQEVFKKYFPSFWPDESKLPGFGYSMDMLCMKKRRLDNILPVVADGKLRTHPLLRTETIEQMVREYDQRCDTGDITQGTKASIPLYRMNVLQPLYYPDYLDASDKTGVSECQSKQSDTHRPVLDNKVEKPAANILEVDKFPRRSTGRSAGLVTVTKNSNEQKSQAGQETKTDDSAATDYFRKGVEELQAGNHAGALKHFNQAIIACPSMPYTNYGIATAYLHLGDLTSARRACQAELSLCPENDKARKLLQRIEETNMSASF